MSFKVLMVCTGNICRSVMAEIVLREHLQRLGMDVEVDSCGISNEEQGNPIDYRAVKTLHAAGYVVPNHSARQLKESDLVDFDLILAMTYRHFESVEVRARALGVELNLDSDQRRLMMFREFEPQRGFEDKKIFKSGAELALWLRENISDVPDPWYGTQADFEETLETLERVVPVLVDVIKQRVDN